MPEEQFVLEVLEKTIGPMLLIMLFSLAGSVFLALCVYNDAKARNNDSAVMWAVLSGFFNIVALVYIIVALASKPKALVCPRCRNTVPAGYAGCPVCGQPFFQAVQTPEAIQAYKRRRMVFLILFISFYVITLLLSFWWAFNFVRLMQEYTLYY